MEYIVIALPNFTDAAGRDTAAGNQALLALLWTSLQPCAAAAAEGDCISLTNTIAYVMMTL